MKIGDSRIRGGPGILPLQHQKYSADKWPLWNRASILAVRITGRADNQGGDGSDNNAQVGHWFEDPETRGDLIGSAFWQRTSRSLGGWRFSWPVSTTDKNIPEIESPVGSQSKPAGFSVGGGQAFEGIQKQFSKMMGSYGVGAGRINTNITFPITQSNQPQAGQTESKTAVVTTVNEKSGCAQQTDPVMIPIFSNEWDKDSRLTFLPYTTPDVWPKFPVDWYGITLAADNENEQQELFNPTDPRLVAVHCYGDKEMGSLVGDMDSGFKMDSEKMARLQSFFKVAKKPIGCAFTSENNTIAWNIGETGCHDSKGGLVWEKDENKTAIYTPPAEALPITTPSNQGEKTVVQKDPRSSINIRKEKTEKTNAMGACPNGRYGHVSQSYSGPFELDCGQDHKIGEDGEGNPIYPVHLSLNSLWTFPGGVFDGPLKHDGYAMQGGVGPIPMNVFFGWYPGKHSFACGERTGKHKWWTTTFEYFPSSPPPSTPPPWSPIRPPIIIPPGEVTGGPPVPGLDDITGDLMESVLEDFGPTGTEEYTPLLEQNGVIEKDVSPYNVTDGLLPYAATVVEGSSPSILFRPQMIAGNLTDFLNWRAPDQDQVKKEIDWKTPITGKIQAWGAQGTKNGSNYLDSSFGWNYTNKPGTYRYGGGTASGGMVLLPPEISLADIDNNLLPSSAGVSTSESYFIAGPGTSLGCGLPDLQNGGLASGFTLFDDSGDLRFGSNTNSVTTNRVVIEAGGNVGIGVDNPTYKLQVKDPATSSVDTDILQIESAGNSAADSWGMTFCNSLGEKAGFRAVQASSSTTSGELEFRTASFGTMVPYTVMDDTGKWAYRTAFMDEVFTVDPENWLVGATAATGVNMGWNTTDVAGGSGIMAIGNATTTPTSTPTGGGVLYVDSGALKYRGSSGTTTTIASA